MSKRPKEIPCLKRPVDSTLEFETPTEHMDHVTWGFQSMIPAYSQELKGA